MDHNEPTDVGPAVGGDLPAADHDRRQCIGVLDAALRDNRLTRPEHDERVRLAERAQTFDDLIPLTRDLLGPGPRSGTMSTASPRALPSIRPEGANPETDHMVAVFSGTDTEMHRLRAHTRVVAVFGGFEVDLRNATFDAPECVIEMFCVFGGLEVKVPEGVRVVNEAHGVMGGVEVSNLQPHPDGPIIVLRGWNVMGGTEVKGPKPGKLKTWLGID